MKKIFIQSNILILFLALLLLSAAAQTNRKTSSEPVIIEDGKGIYGLTVGKSRRADVIKKLGENYDLVRHGEYSYEAVYKDLGVSFYTCQSDSKNEIFVISMKAPFQAKTKSGIVLGESTFADVLRIYGEPVEEYNNNYSYKGIEFYYDEEYAESTDDKEEIKQKKVVAINIIESKGLRQCDAGKETFNTETK